MKILALGDSHIRMYEPFVSTTVMVPGATAYGILNEHSRSDAFNIFRDSLKHSSDNFQLYCLGEVDCNALLWRLEMNTRRFIQLSTNNYLNFLTQYSHNAIVSSVPLPPVQSYQIPPYSLRRNKPRDFVKADRKARTKVVLSYNERLKKLCSQYDIPFLDLTPHIQNGNGILNMKFAKSQSDSHLDTEKLKPIIGKLLDEAKSFYHN